MSLLSAPAKLLVLIFLASTMLSIGMQATKGEMSSLFASRGFLIRVLAANFVFVPLLGFALARLLPLPPAAAATLVLLA